MVSFGKRGGETEIFKEDGSGFLKKFTDYFKSALGPKAEDNLTGKQLKKAEKLL